MMPNMAKEELSISMNKLKNFKETFSMIRSMVREYSKAKLSTFKQFTMRV